MSYDNYRYRPEINKELIDRVLRLSNEIGLAPNKFVNTFVKIGLEVIERSTETITNDFKQKLISVIKEIESKQ